LYRLGEKRRKGLLGGLNSFGAAEIGRQRIDWTEETAIRELDFLGLHGRKHSEDGSNGQGFHLETN
jgi:hypothetical protein